MHEVQVVQAGLQVCAGHLTHDSWVCKQQAAPETVARKLRRNADLGKHQC